MAEARQGRTWGSISGHHSEQPSAAGAHAAARRSQTAAQLEGSAGRAPLALGRLSPFDDGGVVMPEPPSAGPSFGTVTIRVSLHAHAVVTRPQTKNTESRTAASF